MARAPSKILSATEKRDLKTETKKELAELKTQARAQKGLIRDANKDLKVMARELVKWERAVAKTQKKLDGMIVRRK